MGTEQAVIRRPRAWLIRALIFNFESNMSSLLSNRISKMPGQQKWGSLFNRLLE